MVTKTYDGSTTQQLTFDASSSTENILQVGNHTGWSEYRDGDDLVLFSSNANDYLRVFGAYADATRLEYIQYLFDGVAHLNTWLARLMMYHRVAHTFLREPLPMM